MTGDGPAADNTCLQLHTYCLHRQGSIPVVRVPVAAAFDTVVEHTGGTNMDSSARGHCNLSAAAVEHIVEVVLPEPPFEETSERQVAKLPLAVQRQSCTRPEHFLAAGAELVHRTGCCVDLEVRTFTSVLPRLQLVFLSMDKTALQMHLSWEPLVFVEGRRQLPQRGPTHQRLWTETTIAEKKELNRSIR